ncbi:MAG: transglutaminase family protein [Gemmobacter sp.]
MTVYDITARIRYDYSPPASAGHNILRLMPADLAGRQRLILGQIAASPDPAERGERFDFFGNRVAEISFRKPAATTAFTLRARVDRMAEPGARLDLSPPLAELADEIADLHSLAPDAPQHFLGPSPRIAPSDAIAAFARTATARAASTRRVVATLGKALHGAMAFDATATTVDTTPEEAFRLRRGVCQDLAHVMITGLRSLGVPAGYVSGYLRTVAPKGQPRLEGADAMHAWVRAWCGRETGWLEYDPTNAIPAGTGHVIVAYGRDYDDVCPVQGILRLSGAQRSTHSVDTRPLSGE